tara:strand:- start:193 stop:1182 length:990 start_codon:yes stop_codon:yes gene_type:complete
MDIKTALKILCINYNDLNENDLKKAYRKQILIWHPDKNTNQSIHIKDPTHIMYNFTSEQINNRFIEIKNAYNYLSAELNINRIKNNTTTININKESAINNLAKLINIDQTIIKLLFNCCKTKIEEICYKLFSSLNEKTANILYRYIEINSDLLQINDTILEKLQNIVKNKQIQNKIIILQPELYRIYDKQIHVLNYKNEKYYIPLWLQDAEYDTKYGTLSILIYPILPDNIIIDTNNNIVVDKVLSSINTTIHNINVCDKNYSVSIDKDTIKEKPQICIYKSCGIPVSGLNQDYNIETYSDLIIKLQYDSIIESETESETDSEKYYDTF